MWRGKLPHWRAEDETYYVTFRHRRALKEPEAKRLFQRCLRPQGRKYYLLILAILPEETHMLFRVEKDASGEEFELSDIVEKAKRQAGRAIIKDSGERFPPFYNESFDRIMRDEEELQQYFDRLLEAPVGHYDCEDPELYPYLFVAGSPD
jgi:hypothetical protein